MAIITLKTNNPVIVDSETQQSEVVYFDALEWAMQGDRYVLKGIAYYYDAGVNFIQLRSYEKAYTIAQVQARYDATTFVGTTETEKNTELITQNFATLITTSGRSYGVTNTADLSVV